MGDRLIWGMGILGFALGVFILLAAVDGAWRLGGRLLRRLEAWARRRRARRKP